MKHVLYLVFFGVISSCSVPHISEEDLPGLDAPWPPPANESAEATVVTRQNAIQTARRYASHVWTPTEKNVWHGFDPQGIRVDTPDVGFNQPGVRQGWWQVGQPNQGIPFKWGGFSSLEEFDQGIAQGFAAGDVLTPIKGQMLDQGFPTVSEAAVGIGSSGLISRCWNLDRDHSTRELATLCEELVSFDELLPGDIINLKGVHVILFEQFADERRKSLLGYEAGAPPSWKVLYDQLPVSNLRRLGYKPMRYKHIVSGDNDAEVLGLRQFEQPEEGLSPEV